MNRDGSFTDASRFEDLRPVSHEYRSRCHLRVNRYLRKPGGKYLLDVASGPIQYPEHRTYSEGYGVRICGDISVQALREARRRLGDTGRYVQCDIVRLPFKTNAVDGVVSLHTVYHVPAGEQSIAFGEIVRVLKPGSRAVVAYDWANHSPLMTLATSPRLAMRAVRRVFRLMEKRQNKECGTTAAGLYFHPHGFSWVQQNLISRYNMEIAVWRSVSIPFLRMYVHRWLFGTLFLRCVYRLEEIFPGFLGKSGAYPLFIFTK
jgi:ubiquinone/menaquinone biosynthesis C-methylase UbiE